MRYSQKTKSFIFVNLWLLLISGCAHKEIRKVCIKDVCVQAEVADSPAEQIRGLMYRQGLPANSGMLFLFEKESKYSFWMNNMRFALDIIWIDRNKRIVDITRNALPCKEECKNIIPMRESKYVLEVNAGFSGRFGLDIGDKVRF